MRAAEAVARPEDVTSVLAGQTGAAPQSQGGGDSQAEADVSGLRCPGSGLWGATRPSPPSTPVSWQVGLAHTPELDTHPLGDFVSFVICGDPHRTLRTQSSGPSTNLVGGRWLFV